MHGQSEGCRELPVEMIFREGRDAAYCFQSRSSSRCWSIWSSTRCIRAW